MTKKKIFGVLVLVWLISLFFLGLKPNLEHYLAKKIASRTSDHNVHIIPKDIKINILPLGIHLKQVELNIKDQPKNTYIEQISLIPNFQLRKSNLRLIKIVMSDAVIPIELPETKRTNKRSSLKPRKKAIGIVLSKVIKIFSCHSYCLHHS